MRTDDANNQFETAELLNLSIEGTHNMIPKSNPTKTIRAFKANLKV